MSSGMISIVKSMGWEAADDSTPWTSSYSAGEKKGKKQSFSPFSWKMQEIWVPSLGNLSKTNWNHEHLWILHVKQCICTFPSSPSQQSFFGAVLPRLPLASLSLSFGEKKKKASTKSLYDLLFERANEKDAEKEGKETCMCSEMTSSHTMVSKPVPNFCLIFLVASILFTI